MPGFDRSGPAGAGPMTGRAMGYCGGGRVQADVYGRVPAAGLGFGYGRGRGFGRGMAYGRGWSVGPGRGLGWFAAGYDLQAPGATAEQIKASLEERAALLRAELTRTEAMLAKPSEEDGSADA
ncbi:MAG: DUF5320 domain-containing protein [Spirochaetales bacterium]|nr:DUF5320 domain-containing protein [Spirochaetales bacterium]